MGGHELRFSLGGHSTRIIMELEKFRDETKKNPFTMSRFSVQESSEWSLVLYLSVRLLRVPQRGIRYSLLNEIQANIQDSIKIHSFDKTPKNDKLPNSFDKTNYSPHFVKP